MRDAIAVNGPEHQVGLSTGFMIGGPSPEYLTEGLPCQCKSLGLLPRRRRCREINYLHCITSHRCMIGGIAIYADLRMQASPATIVRAAK